MERLISKVNRRYGEKKGPKPDRLMSEESETVVSAVRSYRSGFFTTVLA